LTLTRRRRRRQKKPWKGKDLPRWKLREKRRPGRQTGRSGN
jgi:hypothetical protein